MANKKSAVNSWIWVGIQIAFASYLFFLLISGDIMHFLSPKMLPFAWGGACGFFFLGLVHLKRALRPGNARPLKLGFILFIIPLLLGFGMPGKQMHEEIAVQRGTTIARGNSLDSLGVFETPADYRNDFRVEDVLEIDEIRFDRILQDFQDRPEHYKGQEVELIGFVARQSHFEENMFIVSRLLMTCCVADTSLIGLLVDYEGAGDFENFEWLRVKGVMDYLDFYDLWIDREYVAPIIRLTQYERTQRPLNLYIYPEFYTGPSH